VRKLTDDITALRPTIFPAVPRVLERIQSGIQGKVKAAPWPARALINGAMRWKLARIRAGRPVGKARPCSAGAHRMEPGAAGMLRPGAGPGHARPRRAGGCQGGLLKALASVTADPGGAPVQATPVLDWLLFHRFRAGFGGRVRFIVSGGAPLSTGVAEYLAATLCCPVFQARRRPAAPPRLCSQARWAPGACSCRQARCQLELWQQREERSPLQQVEQGVSCARMVCMAPVLWDCRCRS